jgi:hypothetical protein
LRRIGILLHLAHDEEADARGSAGRAANYKGEQPERRLLGFLRLDLTTPPGSAVGDLRIFGASVRESWPVRPLAGDDLIAGRVGGGGTDLTLPSSTCRTNSE